MMKHFFSPMSDIVRNVAVSVEDSPDVSYFGLDQFHVKDAKAEIALQVLERGRNLVFMGNLNSDDFLDLLDQLLVRYQGHPYHHRPVSVTSYLAWPHHIGLSEHGLTELFDVHKNLARLVLLAEDGRELSWEERRRLEPRPLTVEETRRGLTAARKVVRAKSHARILAGGTVEGDHGHPPGIAEEALLSLQVNQPLYLIGGLGGCAREVAESLGISDPWEGSRNVWPGRDLFKPFGRHSLHNGLTLQENQILAHTPHFRWALTLVMQAFGRIREATESKAA